MMKEINEQPRAVRDTLHFALENGRINLSKIGITEDIIQDIRQVYIVACGSAYHVGMAIQYVMEDLTDLPVRVELASEFRYRPIHLDPKGLVIIISQSGETADSLAALREAKERKRQASKTRDRNALVAAASRASISRVHTKAEAMRSR